MENVILDCGKGYIKVGYGGERRYRKMVPSETTREHVLTDLENPNTRILIPHSANMTNREKETIAEEVLERHGFHSVNFSLEAVLALYSLGLSTGLVVDVGEIMTNAVPIWNGYSLHHSIRQINVSGRQITDYLVKLMSSAGHHLYCSLEDARLVKTNLCYVGYYMDKEARLARETTFLDGSYTIPGGQTIRIGPERFQAPEVLFQPHLMGIESENLAQLVFNTIQNTNVDVRPGLYENIVLIGGSSRLAGLTTRLGAELEALYLTRVLKGDRSRLGKFDFGLDKKKHGYDLGFRGASLLFQVVDKYPEFWVTRKDWDEQGANCLARLDK